MDLAFSMALIAAAGYGLTAVIYKVASQSVDPLTQSLAVSTFTTLTLLALWGFGRIYGYTTVLDGRGLALAAAGGVIAGISLASYIASIAQGDAGVSSTLRNLSFLVTIALSIIFLSEKLTAAKAAGIMTAAVSLLLLSL